MFVCFKGQLPETVRLTKERVLKSLQEELNETLDEKRTKKISKKYKMVKFFGEHQQALIKKKSN